MWRGGRGSSLKIRWRSKWNLASCGYFKSCISMAYEKVLRTMINDIDSLGFSDHKSSRD